MSVWLFTNCKRVTADSTTPCALTLNFNRPLAVDHLNAEARLIEQTTRVDVESDVAVEERERADDCAQGRVFLDAGRPESKLRRAELVVQTRDVREEPVTAATARDGVVSHQPTCASVEDMEASDSA